MASEKLRLFLVFLVIYAIFTNIEGWNENSRLDLTRAIVDHGTFRIDQYANNTGDRAFYDGHYYSDKFPGASFMAVPFYFVYKYTFGTPSTNADFYHVSQDTAYFGMVFFIILFTSVLFSALTVVLLFDISKYFSDRKIYRYLVTIAYGLGTIAFSQATFFLGHAIATFFAFACFYIIFRARQERDYNHYFLAGLLGGIALLVDAYSLGVVFVCFVLVLLTRKLVYVSKFTAGFLIFLLVLMGYNYVCFGGFFSFGYQNYDEVVFSFANNYMGDYAICQDTSLFDHVRLYSGVSDCHIEVESSYFRNILLQEKINGVVSKQVMNLSLENKSVLDSWITVNFASANKRNTTFLTKTEYLKETGNYYIYTDSKSGWVLTRNYSVGEGQVMLDDSKSNFLFVSNCPFWPANATAGSSVSCSVTGYLGSDVFYHSKFSGNVSAAEFGVLYVSSYEVPFTKISYSFDVSNRFYKHNFNIILRLLFYPYRGLFFFNPVLILSLFGLFLMFRRFSTETFLFIFMAIATILFQSFNFAWWGGSSFGPRHFLIFIPFLALSLVFVFEKINIKIILLLLFLSVVINFTAHQKLEQTVISIDEERISFNQDYINDFNALRPLGNPLFDHYIPSFLRTGPRSVVLEGLFNVTFMPFLNVLILLVLIPVIWLKR